MEFLNFDSGSPQVDVDIELWRRVSGIKLSALYSGIPADGYQIKNIYTNTGGNHRCRIRGGTCKAGG